MVAAGILDFTGKGRLKGGPVSGGGVLMGWNLSSSRGRKPQPGRNILITRDDMAYLVDSKAATCGSIGVLMKKYRVGVEDIHHVYLAGAFGAYADIRKIIAFGIIPVFTGQSSTRSGTAPLPGPAPPFSPGRKRQGGGRCCKKDGVH